jgi:CheY-like chemotaxis protein
MTTIPDRCAQDPLEGGDLPGQAQKLETMGRLLGGVAHDFANLVTLITGYSELLLARIGERDPLRPELEEIRNAAHRGGQLTAHLLGYARGHLPQPKVLDLNAAVAGIERMLRPIIGEYVVFETVLAPGLDRVVVDDCQMEQVLMNLILNARDAISPGGRISVETANLDLDGASAGDSGLPPGAYVTVSIRDTGRGIDAPSIERIFEPFFTTKAAGKGTGLGLDTVRTIVKLAGGAIRVRSVPGEGAEFTVLLPRAPRAEACVETADLLRPGPAGSETLLVVEDDECVSRLLGYVLGHRGYQVLEARCPEQALRLFAAHGPRIDLVLTDMVLPGMSGRELAARLLAERPELKVIYMSGYPDDVLLRTGALSPEMSFLQKPLRPEAVAVKIRDALDSPSRPFNPG